MFDAQFSRATKSGANANAKKNKTVFAPTRIQSARSSLSRHCCVGPCGEHRARWKRVVVVVVVVVEVLTY